MKNILLLFVFFFVQLANCQMTRFQLVDDINQRPVQYANIHLINTELGTSSDEQGYFSFEKNEKVYINAVGYEPKAVDLNKSSVKIPLTKIATPIEEIVLHKRKNQHQWLVDSFKKFGIKRYYGLGTTRTSSWIIGNYFSNTNEKPTFLQNVTVLTKSEIENAKFLVRIYNVDENHRPTDEMYHENIIATARKGSHKTTINLADFNIKIPKNGIFIAIDWIKTNENIYTYTYTTENVKGRQTRTAYTPSFGAISGENKWKTLVLRGNEWTPASADPFKNPNHYMILAMEAQFTD